MLINPAFNCWDVTNSPGVTSHIALTSRGKKGGKWKKRWKLLANLSTLDSCSSSENHQTRILKADPESIVSALWI